MLRFLFKDFVRSKSSVAGLSLLLLTGAVSLYIGGLFLDRQARTVAQAAAAQRDGIERTADFVADDDLGLFLYYARFGLVNETPRVAALSIGRRDANPVARLVNVRNLEEQRHASVLMNPLYQLLGNLDFSFVLIYFFPLIVIGFCFNLLSEEREGGTWGLVLSQSPHPARVLRGKLLIRFAAVFLALALLLLAAKLYLRIPTDAFFGAFCAVSVLYVVFWFALSWSVVLLQNSSSQNALTLLLAWVVLTIVVPSAASAVVVSAYPVPEAYEAMLNSREGYHEKWDEPIAPTLAKFKAAYPQFAAYEHPAGASFSWLWYYAMQHAGDAEAAGAAAGMREKLYQRSQFSETVGWFFPSLQTQLALDEICRSDLVNYLAFQDRLAEFHEAKRLGFYAAIFEGAAVSSVDWGSHGTESFRDGRGVRWLPALLPLVLATALVLLLAKLVSRREGTGRPDRRPR